MIKLKDLLLEKVSGEYVSSGLSVELDLMIQKWADEDIEYTDIYKDIHTHWGADKLDARKNWKKRYNYNDVKKFEKKFMKEIYKYLKREGIKLNNPFVKLHSKMLHSKVFSKGGIFDKQLTNNAAGASSERVRWHNVSLIIKYTHEEVSDFLENILVMGR